MMTVSVEDLLNRSKISHPDQLKIPQQSQDEINAFLALYDDLQGNILKSHGRNLSVHLFLEFNAEKIYEAKKWISNFTQNFVTSATKQRKSAQERRRLKQKAIPVPDNLFASFLLSFDGYKVLLRNNDRYNDKKLKDYFKDRAFTNGMKNAEDLADPPVEQWEEGFRKPIHALILLADDNSDFLSTHVENVESEVKEFAEIVHSEFGKVFRKNKNSIEHFGFLDGISQPLFFQEDITNYILKDTTDNKDATDKWNPVAEPKLVLLKDPLDSNKYSCGSYLVYRKLQQDVERFNEEIAKLAKKLEVEKELAEAFVMGRFKEDGTPVTLSNKPLFSNSILNNFNYEGDIHGTRCPFHAHIRKTNPRGEKTKDPDENQRDKRIARRGISYSYQKGKICTCKEQLKYLDLVSINEIANNDVGLLFMCFQSSITNQFITLQQTWANNMHFPKNDTGIDPVIGQGKQLDGGQYWPNGKDGWDENHKGRYDFSKCVQMKGGEYFFAPSISFLIGLPDFTL